MTELSLNAWIGRCMMALPFLLGCVSHSVATTNSDLTIEVTGDLRKYGGVIVVYSLPVPAQEWAKDIGANPPITIRLDARYAQIQLRYPANKTYSYRFRPGAGDAKPTILATQVLSVIGTDMDNRGQQMTAGFNEAYSSGGRILRVLSFAEVAGEDETIRTNARWGSVEGYDALPPADERSARQLVVIMKRDRIQPLLGCEGGRVVQVCTASGERWPQIDALWWRAIADDRLERLRHFALRRCYDSSMLEGGQCEAVANTNEPQYVKRR